MNSILESVTASYDIAADLVTKCYQGLTPWLVDGFEEEGLLPIDEVVEESFLEKGEVDFAGEVDTFYDIDLGDGEFFISVAERAPNSVLDGVFNPDAQVTDNVQGDNDDTVSTVAGKLRVTLNGVEGGSLENCEHIHKAKVGNLRIVDEGTCNWYNSKILGIKKYL